MKLIGLLVLASLTSCENSEFYTPPIDAQTLDSCAEVCSGQSLTPWPSEDHHTEWICRPSYERCMLAGYELSVNLQAGHVYRRDFSVIQQVNRWTICAFPAQSIALWIHGIDSMTMVAQSGSGCLDEASSIFSSTPLRSELFYRVLVISETPTMVMLNQKTP